MKDHLRFTLNRSPSAAIKSPIPPHSLFPVPCSSLFGLGVKDRLGFTLNLSPSTETNVPVHSHSLFPAPRFPLF